MIASQKSTKRLGNLLVERGYLSLEQLQSALAVQQENSKGKLLGEILVEMDFCSEDQVIEALAEEYGVPYAKLEARLQDTKVLDAIPRDYVERNLVLPLFCVRDALTVAVTEPANLFLVEELKCLTGKQIQI